MDKRIKQHQLKQQVIFICCFCFYFISIAQVKNLLRNYSLDTLAIGNCGTNNADVALFWNLNLFNTPLSYNACILDTFYSVPKNQNGFQYTKIGSGYGNIDLIGNVWGANGRLYLQSKLSKKLKNKKHYIYIYISLSDKSTYATSSVQIAFTQNNISNPICCGLLIPLPSGFTPQIQNPIGNVFSDTSNWVKFGGSFKANGNEEYISIGNFKTDINTDTIRINNSPISGTAYYVDDLHLVEEDRAVAYFDTTLEVPLCVNLGDSVVLGDTLVRPWLQYEWKDAFGNILCTTRNCAYYGNSIGTSYATVSITDTAADAYITKAIDTVYITTSTNCPTSLKQIIKESANVKYRIENNQVHVFNLPPNLKNASLQIRNIAGQSLFSTSLEVTSGNGTSKATSNTKPSSVITSGFEKGQNVYSIQKNLPQGFYVIELIETRQVINRGKIVMD